VGPDVQQAGSLGDDQPAGRGDGFRSSIVRVALVHLPTIPSRLAARSVGSSPDLAAPVDALGGTPLGGLPLRDIVLASGAHDDRGDLRVDHPPRTTAGSQCPASLPDPT
jgi:hypothetical protein